MGISLKTASEKEDERFRPIKLEFLKEAGQEPFDIFYKTDSFGTTRFVKFASTEIRHQDKVRKLIESGETDQDFYVREEDLIKYYFHATQHLRKLIANPKVALKEKTQKIYNVSKEIMQEFFDYNASNKILQSADEVMSLMDECFSGAKGEFHSISMITNKDYYTYTHSVNVGMYCLAYGIKTKMPQSDIKDLGLGGMLHDVGKVRINTEILNKDGRLTEDEFKIVKEHSPLGEEILQSMRCYGLTVVQMAGQHHERFDGKGYPRGLAGEEISVYGRICKVMDVYDALTTRRTYKKAMAPFDALTLMRQQMANEFDLQILNNFVRFMGPDL